MTLCEIEKTTVYGSGIEKDLTKLNDRYSQLRFALLKASTIFIFVSPHQHLHSLILDTFCKSIFIFTR